MKRFKKILVVYRDAIGDDDALMQATALATRNGARLTLIEVMEDEAYSTSQRAERRKHLSRLAVSFGQDGIIADAIVCVGAPFLEIIRQVLEERHDLVIMSAESGRGFKSLFFGNTSMHLMRKCPCPVWIVKPGQHANYARILAAVGPSTADVKADDLNVKIMDFATSLARLNQSELHIVHALLHGTVDSRPHRASVDPTQCSNHRASRDESFC